MASQQFGFIGKVLIRQERHSPTKAHGPQVDLAGVPQLPDSAVRMIAFTGGDLSGELAAEADAAIADACVEIRRRKELRLADGRQLVSDTEENWED